MSTQLSLIVPVYNEDAVLPDFQTRVYDVLQKMGIKFELIYVDDGSTDNSLQLIKKYSQRPSEVKFLSFSRNFGHQNAIHAGLDHSSGGAVIIIDSDLQDPPELIPRLWEKYISGFDVVYAKRTERKGESGFKKFTAKLFYRALRGISDIKLPTDVGDFRLIDRKVVEALKQMPEKNKFLRGQISWLGFSQTEVLYEREERSAGSSGYSLRKMMRLAIDGITGFSNVPLKLVTFSGIVVSLISFLVILYALIAHFFLETTITGWTSLIITVSFFGGVQLLSIGIIGTYMSRINNDVRNRPLYVINEAGVDNKIAIERTEDNAREEQLS